MEIVKSSINRENCKLEFSLCGNQKIELKEEQDGGKVTGPVAELRLA